MSFLRVKHYRMRKKPLQLLYFPRKRTPPKKGGPEGQENTAALLDAIKRLERFDESVSRSRRTALDKLLCNKFDFFCTFTFNQFKVDRYNYKECQKKITEVFKNYKNRYSPGFRYMIVPEFHWDHAIHFHGMVSGIRPEDLTVPDYIYKRDKKTWDLILVPNTRKYVDWPYYSKKLGYFSCSRVKNHTACAYYVAKYITKDITQLPKGVHAVMSSKGLERPDLVFDEDDVPMPCDADWKGRFVHIADVEKDEWGFLPDWYGECCSELRDLPELEGETALRDAALFPRLTGAQLKMMEA